MLAAARKAHLLGKRQRLATKEVPRKKTRIWLSEEEKVAHAWVAACDAGDLRTVELLLPVVEHTARGVNCTDGAGVTGLMAALEKGRLEVVDRLLDHRDIDMDFTQTDARGRSALDMVILSPSNHFMDLILDGLATNLVEEEELERRLLPRLLTCVTLGKVKKFKKILDFIDANFQQGALLSFLIISGQVKFIQILFDHCHRTMEELVITEQNKKSLLHALRSDRSNVVQPLFKNFMAIAHFLENILLPCPIASQFSLDSAEQVEAVRKEIFLALKEMIQSGCRSFKPDIFTIGINCININEKDDDGTTLLMTAVKSVFLPAVKLLLKQETLDVNKLSNRGFSALDFARGLSRGNLTNLLSAVANLFIEREAVFKDVNFGNVKVHLLVQALKENRLDLASSLLDCSTYHPSPTEWATARNMLRVGKRVLLAHHSKEDSAEKKATLLNLLHKLERKRNQEKRRSGRSSGGR